MKRLPRGIRKHIRREKARIRREVFDIKEQEQQIQELRLRFLPKEAREAEKIKEVAIGPAEEIKQKQGPSAKKVKVKKPIIKKEKSPSKKKK